MTHLTALPGRAAIEIGGEDRVAFLQGLVSNDVAGAVPGRAVWAALLTPQGKYLADFFILADGARLLLDAEREQAPALLQRLTRFRLRSKVTLRIVEELAVYAAWGATPGLNAAAHGADTAGAAWDGSPVGGTPVGGSQVDGSQVGGTPADGSQVGGTRADATPVGGIVVGAALVAADPRLPAAGWRVLAETPLAVNAGVADWDRHRLALGLPDGTRDLEPEKTVLLEAGFDELHGVSWSKGCYMGQELTARTKYRGLVKRRLVPVAVDGTLPPPGTPVLRDGAEVGTMRSGRDGLGLALVRLEALDAPLACGDARLTVRLPAWMQRAEHVA